jgi:hypothetical protein
LKNSLFELHPVAIIDRIDSAGEQLEMIFCTYNPKRRNVTGPLDYKKVSGIIPVRQVGKVVYSSKEVRWRNLVGIFARVLPKHSQQENITEENP